MSIAFDGSAALGILHLVGLLLTVAIGSNYALFFDHLAERRSVEADTDTLASLLLALTVGLFGITEVWTYTLVPQTVIVDSVGVVILAITTILALRGSGRQVEGAGKAAQ